jgi:hypothetical protein
MREMSIKLLTLMFAVVVCGLVLGTVADGQTRGRRKRPTPAPTVPTQRPQPPPKSEAELLFEKDVSSLTAMSSEDKLTVRAALEGLERIVRKRELLGFNERFIYQSETQKVEELLDKAVKVLPETVFRKIITDTWRAIFDSWQADNAYRNRYADKLLEIVDRYKLDGVAGVLVGDEIHKIASDRLTLAFTEAMLAGIVPIPEK